MADKGQRLAMAFDYGLKSIGIATGQELTGMGTPLTAIPAKDGVPNWDNIQKLLNEWSPDILIVGLPLNMDGTEQTITHRAKKFANRLNGRFNIDVETYDERLTTTDAKAQLFEQGGYRNLEKGKVDAVSAQLILESWFSAQY